MIHIDSLDDGRLAAFRGVGQPDSLVESGVFVAEGRMVVRRLLESSRVETQAVLVTEAAVAALLDLISTRPSLPVYVVSQEVMNSVTGFNFHRGCLALGVRPRARDWREIAAGARRLLALERVGNVDNVGGIFRNAAAFGVDGVLLQSDCADPLYRKSIRTSMAASLSVPFARVEPWPQALEDLNSSGWVTVALAPSHTAAPLREIAAAVAGRPVVVVLGHEGDGLTREALEACSHQARIPMATGVDSLNVATASAVALYELWGQTP